MATHPVMLNVSRTTSEASILPTGMVTLPVMSSVPRVTCKRGGMQRFHSFINENRMKGFRSILHRMAVPFSPARAPAVARSYTHSTPARWTQTQAANRPVAEVTRGNKFSKESFFSHA